MQSIQNEQTYQDLLNEVKIRFNTSPKCYQKEDYRKLIKLIDLKNSGGGSDKDIEKELNKIYTIIEEDELITAAALNYLHDSLTNS